MTDTKKDARIQVRVTSEEKELLQILADGRECSVGALLRPCVEKAVESALVLEAALARRNDRGMASSSTGA